MLGMFSFFLVSVLLGMGAGYFGVAAANARLSLIVTCLSVLAGINVLHSLLAFCCINL